MKIFSLLAAAFCLGAASVVADNPKVGHRSGHKAAKAVKLHATKVQQEPDAEAPKVRSLRPAAAFGPFVGVPPNPKATSSLPITALDCTQPADATPADVVPSAETEKKIAEKLEEVVTPADPVAVTAAIDVNGPLPADFGALFAQSAANAIPGAEPSEIKVYLKVLVCFWRFHGSGRRAHLLNPDAQTRSSKRTWSNLSAACSWRSCFRRPLTWQLPFRSRLQMATVPWRRGPWRASWSRATMCIR